MKRKILVVISEVNFPNDWKKMPLPLISGQTLLGHLIQNVAAIKPARIGLMVEEAADFKSVRFKKQPKIVERKTSETLSRVIQTVGGKNFEGDLVLLSSDFFLVNPGFLPEALKTHQKSESDLTLIAEKVKSASGRQAEDYFVYPGLAVIRIGRKTSWLSRLRPFKPSGQLDVVALVEAAESDDESLGFKWITDTEKPDFVLINRLSDLSRIAVILRKAKVAELEEKGVFFLAPDEVWIDPEVKIGEGTVIYPSVIIEGHTRIGKDCLIYPHCHIINSQIGDRVKMFGSTVIEGCQIEDEVQVGPFSRLRPETWLGKGSRVGNFVEMKKTVFGEGSKAMHLSYLGDATVEENVNVGAGTITCNYDGEKKNKTYIEKEAFIGSGTELVAPVKVGRGAYIAAGSTITEDVSPEALAIARARQIEKPGWAKKRKEKILANKRAEKKRRK